MKRTLLSAVFLCLLVLRASGEEYFWRADGKPVTDREYMKIEKNFGAWLCLIDDKKFFQDWLSPTEGIDIPKLKTTNRPLKVIAVVIFAGPGADERGLSDVTFDIAVKDPKGNLLAQRKNLNGWKNMLPPQPRVLQLGIDYLEFEIGDKLPPGKYMVESRVRDHIKDVEHSLVYSFDVD